MLGRCRAPTHVHEQLRMNTDPASTLDFSPILNSIWCGRIKRDFERGIITNESELQCCFYAHLRNDVDNMRVRLFVEPSLRSGEMRRPDIVIAARHPTRSNTYLALLFLEFKFDLDTYIRFRDELRRLAGRGPGTSFEISNRHLGRETVATTLISDENTRFALGFIGRSDAKAVYANDVFRDEDENFAGKHPDLVTKTALLYGRISPDGSQAFGIEPFGRVSA